MWLGYCLACTKKLICNELWLLVARAHQPQLNKNELLRNANKSDTVAFCPSSALCHVVGPVFQRQPMISVRKNTPEATGWSWYFANSYMPAHWVRLATVIKGNF